MNGPAVKQAALAKHLFKPRHYPSPDIAQAQALSTAPTQFSSFVQMGAGNMDILAPGGQTAPMNLTSDWSLPPQAIRFVVPATMRERMAQHPLTCEMYPLAAGFYPHASGHHMQRVEHDNWLLMYCSEGQGEVSVNNEAPQAVSAGDLISLPPGQPHSYAAHKQQPWTLHWIHFSGEPDSPTLALMPRWETVTGIGLHARLIADFDWLCELRLAGAHMDAYIHAAFLLRQLVSHLSLLVRRRQRGQGHAINIEQARKLMLENVHGSLNLDELARQTRLSKFHFSRKFKALTGEAPIQYFIGLKMQRACHLLDSASLSVKQIAADLGYDDAYYFSRLFKKVMGISPARYRRGGHR